jgi:transposase
MSASKIPDAQWRKIFAFLKGHPNVYAGKQAACRHFVEGVHWILRTGAQWRELPERHGNWNSVYKRFARWEENGVWETMHLEFAQDPDMDSVIPDTTVIRAHMCAAGGSKKTVVRTNKLSVEAEEGSVPKSTSLSMPWAIPCVLS